jgi:hypoxanthine phosphoribosyltransferase
MSIPKKMQEVYAKATCLYSKEEINVALDKMAQEISYRLADSNPIILCVVLGGIIPVGNLLPRLDFPLEIDYIHISRYGNKTTGSDEIIWKAKPTISLEGRTILIVDDILDEGVTLATVIDYCQEQGAKETLTAVLVDKKKDRSKSRIKNADFTALAIDDHFVFGYGLDYQGYLRNAPGIYVVAEEHR